MPGFRVLFVAGLLLLAGPIQAQKGRAQPAASGAVAAIVEAEFDFAIT